MAGGCGVAGGRVLAAGWGRPGGGGAGRQAGAMAEGGQVGGGGRKERRLPPEVNRALYVRNLPFSAGADEIYGAGREGAGCGGAGWSWGGIGARARVLAPWRLLGGWDGAAAGAACSGGWERRWCFASGCRAATRRVV